SAVQLSRKEKMLALCAPIREERVDDRALRMALHRARKTEAFAIQQDFDKAATALVQAIPIPQEITDWIPTDTFIAPTRRGWKRKCSFFCFRRSATQKQERRGNFPDGVLLNRSAGLAL